MKRKCSAFLALLILIGVITSCGKSSDITAETTETDNQETSVTETAEIEDIPNYLTLEEDFGGESFRILGMEHKTYWFFTSFEIYAEAENGDIVNDAVYRRNMAIEEKYNVKIEQLLGEMTQAASNTPLFQLIQKNVLSGEDAYEVFFIPLRESGNIIMNNLARDLYELPYIDFDEEYWNPHTNENVEIAGKLFLTNSDFSLMDKRRTYIVVYNRDLHKEYSDVVIEDHVYDGTWTYDLMVDLMKGASIDLNGDGKFDGNDQWGLAMGSPNDICSLLVGMGGNTIIRDSDGSPINNMLDERMINIAGKLYDSINVSKNLGFYSQQANWTIPGVSGDAKSSHMFKNGKVLFNTSIPQSLSGLSADVEFDYGVLPFPKYDEHQEMYYSFADSFGSVLFGVPFISAKTDMTGFMLEVLSGYSTDTSLNAYYEVSCKIKHVYDETSAEMLDICMDGITFDFGLMFNWGGLRNVAYKPLADGAANTYVSGCESLTQVIEKGINDLYDSVM